MRFYLVNRADRSRAYEVLEWKQAEGIVVLRGQYGVFDNLCDLNDPDIRDEWLLTQDMPDWIREKENAKERRLAEGRDNEQAMPPLRETGPAPDNSGW
jgi:hypothetical protein